MIAGLSKTGVVPVLTIAIRDEADVVGARRRARQLASLVGFGNQDQVRIATAVSEIARSAYQCGASARLEFSLALHTFPAAMWVTVMEAAADTRNLLTAQVETGLIGSRRLMDSFEIAPETEPGIVFRFSKSLPRQIQPLAPSDVAAISAQMTRDRLPANDEEQAGARDLLETLEALRFREEELDRREAELCRLRAELDETNRGVVALYAELDEKADALRAANELKGHFLRHVSHEFRTPLSSILALSQILLRKTDGPLKAEQERQVGYIHRAAQDLTDLVNDLLDLAKVEAGKTEVHLAPVHLKQFFGTLRGVMRPLAVSDTVVLIFEEPPDDFAFESDEAKLAQILRNLISNALKFTERGEVRVAYALDNGRLTITVADTGIGIAPEDQDRIFQEFAQVDGNIQTRVKGTGLGLPLSRKLAALLGGELAVSSRLGDGATFSLTIPLRAFTAETPNLQVPQGDSILIIDDDEASRYVVRQHFRGSRHRVLEASGGIEGAERARFERPALIVLDLMMPDRSGFDVLEGLKGDPATSNIPVIIYSAKRLSKSDLERLGNRHAGIVPKAETWPAETLNNIRQLLHEPDLFAGESAKE